MPVLPLNISDQQREKLRLQQEKTGLCMSEQIRRAIDMYFECAHSQEPSAYLTNMTGGPKWTTHAWLLGGSRSGKSERLKQAASAAICDGASVIVLDHKGDLSYLEAMSEAAVNVNRTAELGHVLGVSPGFTFSHRYFKNNKINPFPQYLTREGIANCVVAAMDYSREPFFRNVSYELLLTVLEASFLIGEEIRSFVRLAYRTSHDGLVALRESVRGAAKAEQSCGKNLDKILGMPRDYFSKVYSSLAIALQQMNSEFAESVFDLDERDSFCDRLACGENVIAVVQIGGVMAPARSTSALLRYVNCMVQHVLLARKSRSPVLLIWDEAQGSLCEGCADFLRKAASKNISVTGANISLHQLYAEVGENETCELMDCIRDFSFGGVLDQPSTDFAVSKLKERLSLSHLQVPFELRTPP